MFIIVNQHLEPLYVSRPSADSSSDWPQFVVDESGCGSKRSSPLSPSINDNIPGLLNLQLVTFKMEQPAFGDIPVKIDGNRCVIRRGGC